MTKLTIGAVYDKGEGVGEEELEKASQEEQQAAVELVGAVIREAALVSSPPAHQLARE